MKNKKIIYEMSLLAILIALLWLLDLTGIGYIPIGTGLTITILVFPVSIAAICVGKKGGILLGLMFGLTSYLTAVSGKDPVGNILFQEHPVQLAVVCIVSRILMGLGVALIYQGLAKLMKNDIIAITVASISGTFLNTLFFLTFFWAFFNNQENLFKVLITAMTVNFLIELIVNTILSIGLSKVVHLFKKRMA